MKINNISFCTILVLTTLITTACVKDDQEKLTEAEKKIINDYIIDHPEFENTKTGNGIYFKEDIAGTGKTPLTDNYIYINYTGRYLDDNSVRETSFDTVEWNASQYFTNYLFGPLKILYGHSMPGINEALSLMKEGGKARVIIPSIRANYDDRPLLYEIELLKVIRKPEAFEDSVLHAYLDSKGFDNSNRLDSIWFKETYNPNPANLVTVSVKDTVYLRFEGRLIDGIATPPQDTRIFDSNLDDAQPLKYVFNSKITGGSILNQTIPEGLKIAIDSMRSGVKATVVIKYPEAFKENGLVHKVYNYVIIPKFQSVVYDIEVVKIKSPAH